MRWERVGALAGGGSLTVSEALPPILFCHALPVPFDALRANGWIGSPG